MGRYRPSEWPPVREGAAAQAVPVLEIGGTHVTAALVHEARVSQVTRAGLDPHGTADSIVDALARAAEALEAPMDAHWVVAVPGPFDYATGVGRFERVGKFEALNGYSLLTALAQRLSPRPRAISFINDAQAYGLGEWWASAQRPARLLCITLGTGVGSAFIEHGRPVASGAEVPTLGEVHRLRWHGHDLEDLVSRRAIIRNYRKATGRELDVLQISRLARSGDTPAITVLSEAMHRLGTILAPWVERFGPDVIVVGGSMSQSWDLLCEPFVSGLGPSVSQIDVRASVLLDEAPLLGAARWLSDELLTRTPPLKRTEAGAQNPALTKGNA